MRVQIHQHCSRLSLAALGLCSLLSAVGCQVDIGGQTLPSAWYQHDDIQYFAPGPEFKLAREAAAQKAFSQDEALRAGGAVVPGPLPGVAVPIEGGAVPIVPLPAGVVPPGAAVPGVAVPVAPVPADVVPQDEAPPDAAPDAEVDMNFDAIQ
jgi:hypothetical protein